MTKQYGVTRAIDAPPGAVWALLTDAASYVVVAFGWTRRRSPDIALVAHRAVAVGGQLPR